MNSIFNAGRVVKQLKKKGALQYSCPVCKGTNFAVQGEIATISTTNTINTLNLGTYVPCAMMICTNCGNIKLFALEILDNEDSSNVGTQE